MSHDLTVWVVDGKAAAAELAGAGFVEADGGYLLQGDGWAMTVTLGPVDDEDIPDEVRSRVAGIRHCVEMMLNATDADLFGRFERLARRLAETGRGGVEGLDLQPWVAPTARPARAAARRLPPSPERVMELAMSWWFAPEALARPGMLEDLMATVARHLPEALPRRYESVVPPGRFKLAETGMEHFVRYLREQRHFALVDPTLPCVQAIYPHGDYDGWQTWASGLSGYIPAQLRFGFDSRILKKAEWRDRLEAAWRALSLVLRPFYADIRLLDGLSVRGKRIGIFRDAERHPAALAFWRGIPPEPAFARVFGDPYRAHWADLPPATEGLVSLGPPDWAKRDCDPTEVPAGIGSVPLPPHRFGPPDREQAQVFPFSRPAG